LAFNVISKNIELNKLNNATASNQNLNALLTKNWFNYIDIDPFGSPVKFLDAGCRMLRNNGLLAVTATDTAPLFGRNPSTCLRRYDAWSGRIGFSHELGLRILLGYCVRTAARYNLGLKPIVVHAMDYYYRLYLYGIRTRGAADEALANIGYILPKNKSNEYKILRRKELIVGIDSESRFNMRTEKGSKSKLLGPLWLGPLFDREFVTKLSIGSHKLGTEHLISKMLPLWLEEASAPVGFYDANLLASELKYPTPPLPLILKTLSAAGFLATRTHFKANAFKTDAPFTDIVQVIKSV
jgi:tRNA (guanine26-N2/guanine27-N2)-dimethyltransferase